MTKRQTTLIADEIDDRSSDNFAHGKILALTCEFEVGFELSRNACLHRKCENEECRQDLLVTKQHKDNENKGALGSTAKESDEEDMPRRSKRVRFKTQRYGMDD